MNNSVIYKNCHLHVFQGYFQSDSRIIKETKSLLKCGITDKIIVICFWKAGLKDHEIRGKKMEIIRIRLFWSKFKRNPIIRILMMGEFTLKTIPILRKYEAVVCQCHSIETLPIGVFLKTFINKNMKIVYDAHELETEKIEKGFFIKSIYKSLEKMVIYKADLILFVSDKIAEWYLNKYPRLKNFAVIRNVPENITRSIKNTDINANMLKEKLGIEKDHLLAIYQGKFSPGRGIVILLNVFSQLNKNLHIVFMGYGDLQNKILGFTNRYPNIHYHPAVNPDEIILYTQSADIGFSLPEDTCLNNRFCLPNKFFEYILSGIPVIVSDFPEMSAIVDKYDCGWNVNPDENSLVKLMGKISKEDLISKKRNAVNARRFFGWHIEEKKYIEAYRKIIRGHKK